MTEADPFAGLGKFLWKYSRVFRAGADVGALFAEPEVYRLAPDVAPDEREEWTQFQVSIIGQIFEYLDLTDSPYELASRFKSRFDREKQEPFNEVLLGDKDNKFLQMTTLETLAEAAENEHQRLARKAEGQLPINHKQMYDQGAAGRWGKISQIIKAASEIGE
ncbi:MAG: hypothetical protein Q7S45_00060 [Candidatus Curtissbacteria bacterium]|nr:hypothetical protein [Candidatus Curtissbacteria bacterium]